jgi:exopolysaccharide biosynthesis polyprenyl glycosylphosphotransferase
MYKKIETSWIKHLDFIVVDLACLQISFVLSYILRHGISSPYSNPIYQRMGILLFLLHICIVFFTECYSGILRRGYLKEFKLVIKYNCILLASILAYMFLVKQSAEYSRWMFLTFWVLNCALMYATHILLKRYIKSLTKKENNCEYLLLITNKSLVQSSTEKFISHENSTLKLKGIVIIDDDMIGSKVLGIPVIANFETMFEYARINIVDQVMLNIYDSKIEEIANRFIEMGITVHINIDRISNSMLNTEVQNVNGYTVVTTSINIITYRQLLLKRLISIFVGIIGILATAVAFIIFAPIIYIQSPGQIFFSQERVGQNGRRFRIYKFRTMYMNAEEQKKELINQNKMKGLMFKMDNDPRVIPIGKFLRAFSIDEFPQFWNIIKGDMSLVGTRPPTVDEYESYELHHKSRLATIPGLTGLWQVSGRSNITDFEEVVKLDNEYIKNWSLGLEIKILFKTVAVVLGRKGSA